jgi:sigma-B regulation protein RsbU (phosphoserine phosphatase)
VVHLVLVLRREEDGFTQNDLETLLLNANLLGRAATNLNLTQQLQEAYRQLDHEMQQVGQMQRHLLPSVLPDIEGLELAASYITSSRAGGDYYDVLPLPDGRWGLFLADVSGHGTPAAVVMAMLHTLLHAYPGKPLEPSEVFAHINQHLLAVAPEGMFATAFYGVYTPGRRLLRYAVAGHPPPRLRRGSHVVRALDTRPGLPLGVELEYSWSEMDATLVPGDMMLLYTDGIIEGTDAGQRQFGMARLDDALRLAPRRADALVRHIERQYQDYCNGTADLDDRTLLAVVAVP